ncbi:TPA: topoisomerase [Candidatus Gastranaerophilales bacterium HUM_5]|jgi:hypothetical protein|nr:MAG TPA: topoisomerase [Candidatus Gastranaerophilales bacterium HUM_4]DAA92151.1 MAG TPA: topoisomerase [Candidatus Gastranaerophilales bacterium HUM_5]DAB13941.1 MAG TPA: topoisomerase [Candidatus Gastranaerophilales bacterium HUM_17]DAB17852.1 MAG TPA: topoisomerase [Candidatus Gastranaerophilales bacterium HUM_19]DAZ24973.1 MAG TPA: Protein of unknown function (DUF1071) [Caudoviricetes sp.]
MGKFEELLKLNVNDKKEKRENGKTVLDYLSWTFAWAEFKKAYPDGDYEILKFEKGGHLVPYMYDETGYMVCTKVRDGEGQELEMWLPVMDSNNKAMKSEPYEYTTKYGSKTVERASMFDVNKAIMRCLVKNIAMYGIGLYIYSGEDLPEKLAETEEEKEAKREESRKSLSALIRECKTEAELKKLYTEYKNEIVSNSSLLDLITVKGNELRGKAA